MKKDKSENQHSSREITSQYMYSTTKKPHVPAGSSVLLLEQRLVHQQASTDPADLWSFHKEHDFSWPVSSICVWTISQVTLYVKTVCKTDYHFNRDGKDLTAL